MKQHRSKMSPRREEPRFLAPNIARVSGGQRSAPSIRTVELTANLEPGGSAAAEFLSRYTDAGGGGDRLEANGETLTVYDSHSWSFGLDGMWLAVWNMYGRWETLPCQNINNILAKVDSGVTITDGNSGTVSVWHGGSDSGLNVTAYLDWIQTESIGENTEILIDWNLAQQKWLINDNACA